jgi:dipeptidyl aminopeptidase/acylaminoacyl peptidase
LKWIVRLIVALLTLVLLAIAGVALFPVSPYEPSPRDLADETEYDLDEKVGWYQLDDGSLRLLTWGDERGLTLYRFGNIRENLGRATFHPQTRDLFVSARDAEQSQLEFLRDDDGSIVGSRRTTSTGVQALQRTVSPYETREVRFASGAIELAGLLFLPSRPGSHPAVAFIHGSGTSTRDAFWYLTPADYLARRGIVVLLPDKRGCGKSGGEWHTSSFQDYAEDALAAVRLLAETPRVDANKIGLIGFSQGGWIAPLAASQSPDVVLVVTVSGSAATPSEQIVYEVRQEMAGAGAPGWVANALAPLFARRAKKAHGLWWELNGSFDPIPVWQTLSRPTLAIFGEKDQNVNVSRSLRRLEEAGLVGKEDFSTLVFPDLSHGLIREDTGWLEPKYLRAVLDFIVER